MTNQTINPSRQLWSPYIEPGKVTIVAADAENDVWFKTTLLIKLCADFSQGILPNNAGTCEPEKIAYFMAQDRPGMYEHLYRQNGGKVGSILWIKGRRPVEQLKNEIEQLARNGYGLIVVDPLWMYYRTSAGRELVDELTEEAKRSGVAILASNIWTIEGHEDNTLQIEHHKDFRHAYHGRNDGNVHLLVKAKAGDFSFRRIGDAVVYCSVD